MTWTREHKWWAFASILLLLDAFLTHYGVTHGGHESNPLTQPIVEQNVKFAMYGWRAAFVLVSLMLVEIHWPFVRYMLIAWAVLFTLVDAWGLYQLLGQIGISECGTLLAWGSHCDPTKYHW